MWNNKGITLYFLNKKYEAITPYEESIRLDSDYVSAWRNKGDALQNLSRNVEAVKAYEQALALDAKFAGAWNDQSVALENLKRYEDALKVYEQAIRLDSNYVFAWRNKGDALRNLSRYEEAFQAYEQALVLDAKSAYTLNHKGLILICLHQLDQATECFEKAIKINAQNADYWNNLGYVYYYKAKYKRAIEFYDKALEISPNDIYILNKKAVACLILDKFAEVKVLINKILKINSKFPLALLAQSLIFYSEDKEQAASELLEQLNAYYQEKKNKFKTNEQLEIYFYAVTQFIHLKRYDLAQAYITKGLLLNSKYKPIVNLSLQLNKLLLANTNDFQNTLKSRETQIETLTNNFNILQIEKDNLAENYAKEIKDKTQLQQDKEQLLDKFKDLEQRYQVIYDQNTDLFQEKETLIHKMNELKIKLEEIKAEKNYDSIAMLQQRLEHAQAEYTNLYKTVAGLVEINEKQEKEICDLTKRDEHKQKIIQTHQLMLDEQAQEITKLKAESDKTSKASKDKQHKKEHKAVTQNESSVSRTLFFSNGNVQQESGGEITNKADTIKQDKNINNNSNISYGL